MKAVLVANWKMNPETYREAKLLFEATKKAAEKAKNVQVVLAPPAIFLRELVRGYRGRIAFGLQSGHEETHGAHTGEISYAQARDGRASYAIIGHAERRALGETNEDTKVKVAGALKSGLMPILCVGEEARIAGGEHFQIIKDQLSVGLREVPANAIKRVTIAYEPVWAIGAKTPMTPRDMHEMAIFIRKSVVDMYGEAGMDIRILYGGSIDENSAASMLRDGDVRGVLVGRASADSRQITNLLAAIEAA